MTDGAPAAEPCDQYLVQYGKSGGLGCFLCPEPTLLPRGCEVLVETPRGVEIGTVVRPASLLQARLFGAAASGKLLRPLAPSDQAARQERGRRAEVLFAAVRDALREAGGAIEAVDVELTFDESCAIVHLVADANQDLASCFDGLKHRFALNFRIENLASETQAPTPEPESAGCGKPDCGKSAGSSCGSGGSCSTCSGCGSAKIDWKSYFGALRDRIPAARRPLL